MFVADHLGAWRRLGDLCAGDSTYSLSRKSVLRYRFAPEYQATRPPENEGWVVRGSQACSLVVSAFLHHYMGNWGGGGRGERKGARIL